MSQIKLGMEGGLYLGPVGGETEVTNIKDLTLNLETGEYDRTTRGSGGWREIIPSIRSCHLEFELVPYTEEVDLDEWEFDYFTRVLREAYLSGQATQLIALSGKRCSGSEGVAGDFSITGFQVNQPLEGGQTISVTAKLKKLTRWLILEVFQREQAVMTSYGGLWDFAQLATLEVTCSPTNAAPVYFEGDDLSDVPWQPGECHTFHDIDTRDLRWKGTSGDKVIIRSTQWQEI